VETGGISEAITSVDRTLVGWARKIRLFYYVAPANEAEVRARFLDRHTRDGQPRFDYRPLEFSTAQARRDLEKAPMDAIGDEILGRLYEQKRWEIERLIALLEARGKADFLKRSIELFGSPPPPLVRDARQLLAETRWVEHRTLEAEEVRGMLKDHLERYRRRYRDFDCQVVLDGAMSAKMYVHENRIHLKRGALFSREAARCDTVHEIDAHVLSFLNGRRQPLCLFEIGPRGTLAYQESLGVFTEIANGVMFPGRVVSLAARVVAVAAMVDGATFSEVFDELTAEYGLDEDEAFLICVRVFRGGGFTKDWLYVAELERIFRHWASGGDMEHLLLAKVTMDEQDTVRHLAAGGVLLPARFLPEYLDRISGNRSKPSIEELLGNQRISLGDLLSLDLV
jgi:uncharacterized protein (TIGR02421 family)